MKKILKYSTIIGTAALLTASTASADTGGYVRLKGMDSHFHSLGFNQLGCQAGVGPNNCRLASEVKDVDGAAREGATGDRTGRDNELRFGKDSGEGIVVGADFGFFRLEVEGTYQDSTPTSWRGHSATDGKVYQARLFANVVAEPFDLLELLGEYGGIDPLVTYNPAHYGISPYAMWGYGVMGGFLHNLSYTRTNSSTYVGRTADATEQGVHAGGAVAATNVGAGVNFSLDKLARSFSDATGASVPEYFKLPIEISAGYHWQVSMDDLLFDSIDEDLGIDDGGFTWSAGLKW